MERYKGGANFLYSTVNRALLVCPLCKGSLSFTRIVRIGAQIQRGRISCGSCATQFEVAARIPILLPPGQYADWTSPFVEMIFSDIRTRARPDPEQAIEKYSARRIKALYSRLIKGEWKPHAIFEKSIDNKMVHEGARRITKRAVHRHFRRIREQTTGMKSLAQMVRHVKESRPSRILDQCCGGGFFLACLLEEFTSYKQLFSFDIDYHCVKRVEGILRHYRLMQKSLSMVADARAQPFPLNSFDIITSNYGFSHILGYSKALSETYRTLKPGSFLVLREGFGLARYPRSKELLKGFTAADLIRLHKFGDAYVGKESFLESVRNHGFIIDRVQDFKEQEGRGCFVALCRKLD